MLSVRHKQAPTRGNMAILVMIIAGYTGMVVLALMAVSAATVQTHKVAHQLRMDLAQANAQQLLAEDALAWLDSGTLSTADTNVVRARDDRLTALAEWGGGLSLDSISRGALAAPLFSKGALLAAKPGDNPLHPLESVSGAVSVLETEATFADDYLGSFTLEQEIHLRETPACDIGYVAIGPFQPAADSIPITVTGIAYFPNGASAAASPGKLTADRLVSPSLPAGLEGISTRRHINPIFRGSWGVPSPASLAAPTNVSGTPAPQSYFNGVAQTLSVQDSGLAGAPIAGVAYREFPTGGPERVVITLADLPPGVQRIYVNCESPTARTSGIVLIGDPNAGPGVTRTIATNGQVWLWGDNQQPVGVATTSGEWVLTDGNWTEADLPGPPALNLAWAGHLFSPADTTFSTPQSGAGSRLNLYGSLSSGPCGGQIESMTIIQQGASPLRQLVERIAYLYHFN